jgi:hypothetical protein
MKNYNITLTETELLNVVNALEALKNGRLTEMHALSQRIQEQAAEQFHDMRLQPWLPYGAPGE